MMRRFAVIGDPINHSLSPLIHNAAFKFLGAECEYFARRVERGGLAKWLDEVKREGVSGFNATMPHKVDIIPLLDELDAEADFYHSVNTVNMVDGKLKGFNTDAEGFSLSLAEVGISLEGKRVLIAGAGGVTNTLAALAFAKRAKGVRILNRTPQRAEELCAQLERRYGFTPEFGDLMSIVEYAEDTDIFINATPLGMHGVEAEWDDLGFVSRFKQGSVVYDLIYNPVQTRLLACAEAEGHLAVNGLSMLIYQAVLADEIYLDTKTDRTKLKNDVASAL